MRGTRGDQKQRGNLNFLVEGWEADKSTGSDWDELKGKLNLIVVAVDVRFFLLSKSEIEQSIFNLPVGTHVPC